MKFKADSCLKCGIKIIENGRPLSNYKVLAYKLSNGNVLSIGFCNDCQLIEQDYSQAMEAFNSFHKPGINADIVEFYGTEDDILKQLDGQMKICDKCKKEIMGKYVVSNGKIMHEVCKSNDFDNKAVENKTAGSVSREHNIKEPRGFKNV